VTTALSATILTAIPAALASEIGPNDFRISQMGPDGDPNFDAGAPAIAYNPADQLFLVVWSGDDDTGDLVEGETEVYGQLLTTAGAKVGPQFRISQLGSDGFTNTNAGEPAVTYNPDANEFLVVWSGIESTVAFAPGREIYGQRLDGSTGAAKGVDDFRISEMGPDGDSSYTAFTPAVAYNTVNNRYLVVWRSDDDTGPLVDDEMEIFGQLLDGPSGIEIGDDFRVSDAGLDGVTASGAFDPDVAYNPSANEFLVVWQADEISGAMLDGEFEVYGQRLTGPSGAQVGGNDFRISDMGIDGGANLDGTDPAVAYNSDSEEYLVVWGGDNVVDFDSEIFGQRLSSTGVEVGTNDFRISDMGPENEPFHNAIAPDVAVDEATGRILVVWWGNQVSGSSGDVEVFAQQLSPAGSELGDNDFTLSDMGPPMVNAYWASFPALAHGNPYLVVWSGEDDTPPLVDEEFEIFGQLWEPGAPAVGLVDVSSGVWHLRNEAGVVTSFFYGNPGDLPIAGDWDGDGDATPGLYRQSDGFFYSRNSNTQGVADAECFAGNPEDVPVVGDWDGDGDDNLGIYRPSEQRFYLFTTTCVGPPMGAAQINFLFGNPGDKPVAGDFDGDGIDEVGLHRESTGFFYWRNTLDTGIADGEIFFGDPGDRFISGDFGVVDGVDTPAIYRPLNQTFYFRHTLTQGIADSQFNWPGAQSHWHPVSGAFGLD
jgi:hypothetical protein